MSDPSSKLQRLQSAGILENRQYTTDEINLIATITDDEINVLIQLR